MNDKEKLAAKLADELRTLADACEAAARGDEQAKATLRASTDGYWFALIVGRGEIQDLTSNEE